MDEFVLSIDPTKFRSTNAAWNALMLNDPWSVGYVTTIIELKEHSSKEDWENFYYKTGEYREAKISLLNHQLQSLLNNESLVRTNKYEIRKLSPEYASLNTLLGRTFERLRHKGEVLFNEVKHNGLNISVEECIECIRFRTICETWNGVILREKKTIATLQSILPGVEFRKVRGEEDHKYAVDYEVYKQGHLSSAIQVKPKSYLSNAPYIEKARLSNKKKNEAYTIDYKVPVFNIIADIRGRILNMEILNRL